jgi:hypothetical protein
MARRVRDANLETRAARAKLATRGKPYWRAIGPGLHIGYRKGKRGAVWIVRRYAGNESYNEAPLGQADDALDADGNWVLDFWQAQERARSAGKAPASSVPIASRTRSTTTSITSKAAPVSTTPSCGYTPMPCPARQ